MNWMIQRIFIALATLNGQLSRKDNISRPIPITLVSLFPTGMDLLLLH